MENFEFDMPKDLAVGDKVTGVVVQVEDKTIYLDVKSFTEAVMHLDHYTKDKNVTTFKGLVKVNDEIKCQVTKINEEHIYVSRLNQLVDEAFKEVVNANEAGDAINVVVKKEVNKGYLTEYKANQLFLPVALAGKDVKVGDKLKVKIVEVEEAKKRAVVSRKAILDEEYKEEKQKQLDLISVGDVIKATVVKVEKFGAILKNGNVFGLLRASQVSHKFVDITAELKVDDELEVKVIKKENDKIEFSRKALLKTPFELYVEAHKVSDKVTGKVVEKLGYGLILELAEDVKGLLHKSEYSHNPNDNLSNCVKIGDELEVAIIKIDNQKEKLSLSRKALMDNPWEKVNAKLGDLVDVKVTAVADNGLTVSALGVDGFIPASEALVEKKNDSITNYFAEGDEAKAVITEINPKEWKLKLSIRKHLDAEARKEFEEYLNNQEDVKTTLGDVFKDVLK
jgi:small subunit ribosomal protein S1